ncbi:MAG: hypothetical protein RL134_2539 [Actinomycetota bacterium]
MSVQIRSRRDTAANWATNNPVLGVGEIGIEIDVAAPATAPKLKVGNGVTAWNTLPYLAAAAAGALLAANNLSDLANVTTARSNLGLGGAATLNVGTAAGTVAAGDDSRITGAAQKASNLSDLGNVTTARSNLGLGGAATLNVGTAAGTVAAGDDSRITGAAQKASNLSDLTNVTTARSNLGLGTAATKDVPATGNAAATEVVQGNDTRLTDSRTPSAHASTHSSGGTDPISHNNLAGLTTGDPHTQYQLESEKAAANGYASLDAGTKVPIAQIPTGTTGTTVPFGNDARFTDARTPTAHASTHSSGGTDPISHNNLAGLTTGDPHTQYQLESEKAAANGYASLDASIKVPIAQIPTGTTGTTVPLGNDARFTDTRTPTDNTVSTIKIVNDAVDNTKLANMATATLKGRNTAGTGDPEDLSTATVAGMLAVGGDLTGTVGNALIAANAVTNADLADMATATLKGRLTAGTGDPEDLTGTQATTLLDVFTTVLKGLVPSGGSTATFLRGDATWQSIAGGGDMLRANNLSDVLSVATARTNLGLGSLATLAPPGTTTTYLRGDATFQTLPLPQLIVNGNSATQAINATDTYLTGSSLAIGGRIKAGTHLRWRATFSKTAFGTAAPQIFVRFGTAGAIADAARCSFNAFAVQTAAADTGWFDIELSLSGSSATALALATITLWHKNTNTGIANVQQQQMFNVTSAAFDTTGATLFAGLSVLPNTSAVWTFHSVAAQAFNLT